MAFVIPTASSLLIVIQMFSMNYAYYDTDSNDVFETALRQSGSKFMNESVFGPLTNYHVNAKVARESDYPWIARVVHSRYNDRPYVCTASCIKERIFITASRCIHSLKVKYTSVIYKSINLQALAIIFPTNGSQQAYDDIGLIVVEKGYKEKPTESWSTIKLMHTTPRPDSEFNWYAELNLRDDLFKVIGYACEIGARNIYGPDTPYKLRELDVIHSYSLCRDILNIKGNQLRGFVVPCFFACTAVERANLERSCYAHLGVEGAPLVDRNRQTLFGVSTWGSKSNASLELPVGFAVPNSIDFITCYKCAQEIADDETGMDVADLPSCKGV